MEKITCALCADDVHEPLAVNKLNFCCPGCLSVWEILKSRGELEKKENSPLFQEALRVGVISNPEKQMQKQKQGCTTLYFYVKDLWCPSCAKVIGWVCERLRGVYECVVDYTTDFAFVTYHPMEISEKLIFSSVTSIGYTPVRFDQTREKDRKELFRLGIAAFFTLQVMMFSYPIYATHFVRDLSVFPFLLGACVCTLPVLIYGAYPIWKRGWRALCCGIIGMEFLISVALLSAFFYSMIELFSGGEGIYFDTLCVLTTFVLFGKQLEKKAKRNAQSVLEKASLTLPKKARVFQKDRETFIPIEQVELGATVVVHASEQVVLDGTVIEGVGSVSEAVVTGESMPIPKKVGDRLIAGSKMISGQCRYLTQSTAITNTLQKLLQVVEGELKRRVQSISPIERLLSYFVPSVLLIAASACFFHLIKGMAPSSAFLTGISVLVVACPCAIGIACPLVESNLIAKIGKLGGIVKNRNLFSKYKPGGLWVFDKTGTVTTGQFTLLTNLGALDTEQLRILKTLAQFSSHPLTDPLQVEIKVEGEHLTDLEQLTGRGVSGDFRGKTYYLGSKRYLQELGIHVPEMDREGRLSEGTTLYFANKSPLLFPICLKDMLRPEFSPLISMKNKILLSGDQEKPVREIAKLAGFTQFYSRADPIEKCAIIEQLRLDGKPVYMVGDGVNDAPSLAAADVGVALASGQNMTVHMCDLLLIEGGLCHLQEIERIILRGKQLIRQNLFWAFFYNGIAMFFAFFGYLHPLISAASMTISSLIVLINSRRL